jgi:hypothetical protein
MVFRTRALKTMNLKSKGFEIEPEIIMESWKRGLKISETRIRVPKLSKSKFYSMDSLKISTFFDIWVLRNMGSVPPMKRLFLLPFCITGLLLSSIPLFVDRL